MYRYIKVEPVNEAECIYRFIDLDTNLEISTGSYIKLENAWVISITRTHELMYCSLSNADKKKCPLGTIPMWLIRTSPDCVIILKNTSIDWDITLVSMPQWEFMKKNGISDAKQIDDTFPIVIQVINGKTMNPVLRAVNFVLDKVIEEPNGFTEHHIDIHQYKLNITTEDFEIQCIPAYIIQQNQNGSKTMYYYR